MHVDVKRSKTDIIALKLMSGLSFESHIDVLYTVACNVPMLHGMSENCIVYCLNLLNAKRRRTGIHQSIIGKLSDKSLYDYLTMKK